MNIDEQTYRFWFGIQSMIGQFIPNHIKNLLHLGGFSNHISLRLIDHGDMAWIENFARTTLPNLLQMKCQQININFDEKISKHFYGSYAGDMMNFRFGHDEKQFIKTIANRINEPKQLEDILSEWKRIDSKANPEFQHQWFFDEEIPAVENLGLDNLTL